MPQTFDTEQKFQYLKVALKNAGDMIYQTAEGYPNNLPAGTEGQVLRIAGGLPAWGNDTSGVTPNNVWQRWREVGDLFDINVLKVNTSNQTVLNCAAGTGILIQHNELTIWSANSSGQFVQDGTYGSDLIFNNTSSTLRLGTSSGSDNKSLFLCGGGAADALRGAFITLRGDDVGGASGFLDLNTSSKSGAILTINNRSSDGTIDAKTNNLLRWQINSSGQLVQDGTNGGDIVLNVSGAQIRQGTSDASDTKSLQLSGGGSADTTRGAHIVLYGNDHASLGALSLSAGGTGGGVDIASPFNAISFRPANGDSSIKWQMNPGYSDLVYTGTGAAEANIRAGTSDGADSKALVLCGGGTGFTDFSRGASITVAGNEHGQLGSILIDTGNNASASIIMQTRGSSGDIRMGTGGTVRWSLSASAGNLLGEQASNTIMVNSSDGADNKALDLAGGGGVGHTRGSYISLRGNEHGSAGALEIVAGSGAGGAINFYTGAALRRWYIGSSGELAQDGTNGSEIIFAKTSGLIRQGTSDTADNGTIQITGGGAASDSRGAYVNFYGNENAGTGKIQLIAGNVTGGDIELAVAGSTRWTIQQSSSGNLVSHSTNGGDISIERLGKTLKLKEGSNAKMGVATLVNGTVTVSTTAVTASSRILLSRLVQAGTTVGNLGVGTITAATSFVINSYTLTTTLSADDDSQILWVILEPA